MGRGLCVARRRQASARTLQSEVRPAALYSTTMRYRVLAAILFAAVVVEFGLAIRGPIAFARRPTVVVMLPAAFNVPPETAHELFAFTLQQVARSRKYRVVSHTQIETYYEERGDRPDFAIDRSLSYFDYAEIARELEIEYVLTVSIIDRGQGYSITHVLRRISDGGRLDTIRTQIDSLDAVSQLGRTLDLAHELRVASAGVEVFDAIYFALLALELLLALVLAFRPGSRLLQPANEVILSLVLLVGAFASVYGQNAGLDYIQRLIVAEGHLDLAADAAAQTRRVLLRFMPLVAVNVTLYGLRRRRTLVDWALPVAIVSAVVAALAFPSFLTLRGLPLLAWFALVPLVLVLRRASVPAAAWYFVIWGAVYTLVLNYWHSSYSAISLAFSVGLSAVLYALAAFPFAALTRYTKRWGFIWFAALWVGFDYLRSIGFLAYPWGYLGASQFRWLPIIQIADLGGLWLVTFVVVISNAAIAWWLDEYCFAPQAGRRERSGAGARQAVRDAVVAAFRSRYLAMAGGVIVVTLLYGWWQMHSHDLADGLAAKTSLDNVVRVVLVQQNTDPRQREYEATLSSLIGLSNRALARADRPPDLIVWPEGGLKTDPNFWLERPERSGRGPRMMEEFYRFVDRSASWVLTGASDHTFEEEPDGARMRRNYNAGYLFAPDRSIRGIYHKMRLVPFTEHFPFRDQLPWVAALLDKFSASNWKAGSQRTVLHHPRFSFHAPICFEDLFPDHNRRFVNAGSEVIVGIGNDYWALTPVEGVQHATQSIFRAVENRRPMVRATTSGLTAVIDPTGRIRDGSPRPYTAAQLTADVVVRDRGRSVYGVLGDWFAWLALALGVGATLWVVVSRRRAVRTAAG